MTKEEILKEFYESPDRHGFSIGDFILKNGETIAQIPEIGEAVLRITLSVVEQSLPKKKANIHTGGTNCGECCGCGKITGFNKCLSQVLENALRIVGGGENKEKR